jgi:phosphate transport system substrate-binding protein
VARCSTSRRSWAPSRSPRSSSGSPAPAPTATTAWPRPSCGTRFGYLELTHALEADLHVADVGNVAGRFVSPSLRTVASAAEDMAVASVGDFSPQPPPHHRRRAYPISSYTYLIVFARQDDSEKGRVRSTLLQYLAGPGQSAAARLHCTPVPATCASPSPPRSASCTTPTAASSAPDAAPG